MNTTGVKRKATEIEVESPSTLESEVVTPTTKHYYNSLSEITTGSASVMSKPIPLRVLHKTILLGKAGNERMIVEAIDKRGDTIIITFFKEAARSYVDEIIIGNCYIIFGTLKIPDPKYNQDRLSILMVDSYIVEPIRDCTDIPSEIFDPVDSLATLAAMTPSKTCTFVDILGFVSKVARVPASGSDSAKRLLTLTDDSGQEVELQIWQAQDSLTAGVSVPGLKYFRNLLVVNFGPKPRLEFNQHAYFFSPAENERIKQLLKFGPG